MERPLAYSDIKKLLERLTGTHIILVGGQAINFWAGYFLSRVAELAAEAPYTSNDIDFCGTRDAVVECAERLGTEPLFPPDFDPTPNTGAVTFVDAEGVEWKIDFIGTPYGLDAKDVFESAVPISDLSYDTGQPTGIEFWVMHPERCMESRVHNVLGLRKDGPVALKQLRASVFCAREYLRDLLASQHVRPVLKLNERIFNFCMNNIRGKLVHAKTGVDPFDAVICAPELPHAFNVIRYPQMKQRLAERRQRIQVLLEREQSLKAKASDPKNS